MDKKKLSYDQVIKGGALGVLVYLCDMWKFEAELTAVIMPAAAYGLHWLSTKVGDPNVASFLAKNTGNSKAKK